MKSQKMQEIILHFFMVLFDEYYDIVVYKNIIRRQGIWNPFYQEKHKLKK